MMIKKCFLTLFFFSCLTFFLGGWLVGGAIFLMKTQALIPRPGIPKFAEGFLKPSDQQVAAQKVIEREGNPFLTRSQKVRFALP